MNNDITIRPAVLTDCPKLAPLQEQIALLHHNGRPDLLKKEARRFDEKSFAERLENDDHTMLIAETSAGEVVGYTFAWVVHCRDHAIYTNCDWLYIDDICVLDSHRRQGIGRMLFERCKEIAQQKKCKMVELGVWSFNRDAIAFYESLGMTERSRRMEYILDSDE